MVVRFGGRRIFISNPRSTFAVQIFGLAAMAAALLFDSGGGDLETSNDVGACICILLLMVLFFVPQTIVPRADGSQLRHAFFFRKLDVERVAAGSFTVKEGVGSIVDDGGVVLWQAPVVWFASEGQRDTTRALLRFAQSLGGAHH